MNKVIDAFEEWLNWLDVEGRTFIAVVLIVIAVGVVSSIDRTICYDQTQDIGYPAKWGIFSSCMIEVEPDRWIPIGNYQYVEEAE